MLCGTKNIPQNIVILAERCYESRGGHSIVKLKTMCNGKISTFSKLHHPNGSNFYQIFLGVDIHGIYYIIETDNQI